MRTSQIKQKLHQGQPALITTLHMLDPSVFELASLMGFDGLWIDMEHRPGSLETVSDLMRAARVGSSDIVARPGKGEFMRMSRMLELGAQAIMYPRCESAAEAREVVRWCKFAPIGERGIDGAGPDSQYMNLPLVDYIEHTNQQTLVIVQLEQPQAIEAADEIAQVEGVDALMIGPGDLSILSGIPGEIHHEKIHAARRTVSAAASAAGKHWGCPTTSLEDTQALLDLGARLLFHGADLLMIKDGLAAMQRDFGPLGFTFNNTLSGTKN